MPKVSQNAETVEKKEVANKLQQQKTTPEPQWFYWGKMSGDTWFWRQLHKTRGSHGSGGTTIIFIKNIKPSMTGARTPPCFNSDWSLSEVNMFLPPLGGGIFSSTKCLLYPFPVSRPITWRYYLREIRPVRFLIRTHGHIKDTNVNLIIHLYVTSELCLKFRKYDPMGVEKQ